MAQDRKDAPLPRHMRDDVSVASGHMSDFVHPDWQKEANHYHTSLRKKADESGLRLWLTNTHATKEQLKLLELNMPAYMFANRFRSPNHGHTCLATERAVLEDAIFRHMRSRFPATHAAKGTLYLDAGGNAPRHVKHKRHLWVTVSNPILQAADTFRRYARETKGITISDVAIPDCPLLLEADAVVASYVYGLKPATILQSLLKTKQQYCLLAVHLFGLDTGMTSGAYYGEGLWNRTGDTVQFHVTGSSPYSDDLPGWIVRTSQADVPIADVTHTLIWRIAFHIGFTVVYEFTVGKPGLQATAAVAPLLGRVLYDPQHFGILDLTADANAKYHAAFFAHNLDVRTITSFGPGVQFVLGAEQRVINLPKAMLSKARAKMVLTSRTPDSFAALVAFVKGLARDHKIPSDILSDSIAFTCAIAFVRDLDSESEMMASIATTDFDPINSLLKFNAGLDIIRVKDRYALWALAGIAAIVVRAWMRPLKAGISPMSIITTLFGDVKRIGLIQYWVTRFSFWVLSWLRKCRLLSLDPLLIALCAGVHEPLWFALLAVNVVLGDRSPLGILGVSYLEELIKRRTVHGHILILVESSMQPTLFAAFIQAAKHYATRALPFPLAVAAHAAHNAAVVFTQQVSALVRPTDWELMGHGHTAANAVSYPGPVRIPDIVTQPPPRPHEAYATATIVAPEPEKKASSLTRMLFSVEATPTAFLNTQTNTATAIRERAQFATVEHPSVERLFRSFLVHGRDLFFPNRSSIRVVSTEDWIAAQPPGVRDELTTAWNEIKAGRLVGNRDFVTSIFRKGEAIITDFPEERKQKYPRAITVRKNHFKVLVGPFFAACSKYFQEQWSGEFPLIYGVGKTAEQLGEYIDSLSNIDDPLYVCTDYTNWDNTMGLEKMGTEVAMFCILGADRHCPIPGSRITIASLMLASINRRGATRDGIKYTTVAGRASGDYQTTCGNTPRVALQSLFRYCVSACRQPTDVFATKSFSSITGGDDDLVAHTRFEPLLRLAVPASTTLADGKVCSNEWLHDTDTLKALSVISGLESISVLRAYYGLGSRFRSRRFAKSLPQWERFILDAGLRINIVAQQRAMGIPSPPYIHYTDIIQVSRAPLIALEVTIFPEVIAEIISEYADNTPEDTRGVSALSDPRTEFYSFAIEFRSYEGSYRDTAQGLLTADWDEIGTALGSVPKTYVTTDLDMVDFYSSRAWPTRINGRLTRVLGPKVFRTLAKAGHGYMTAPDDDDWRRGVIQGGLIAHSHVPVLCALWRKLQLLVPEGKRKSGRAIDPDWQYKIKTEQRHEVAHEAYVMFEKVYGFPAHFVEALIGEATEQPFHLQSPLISCGLSIDL